MTTLKRRPPPAMVCRTAYHEAGHYVAARELGLRAEAALYFSADEWGGGVTNSATTDYNMAVIAFAGPLAASKFWHPVEEFARQHERFPNRPKVTRPPFSDSHLAGVGHVPFDDDDSLLFAENDWEKLVLLRPKVRAQARREALGIVMNRWHHIQQIARRLIRFRKVGRPLPLRVQLGYVDSKRRTDRARTLHISPTDTK